MKKILVLLCLVTVCLAFSQVVHIKYVMVRSPIANVTEDLYIRKDSTISVVGDEITWTTTGQNSKSKTPKLTFMSKTEEVEAYKKFDFTAGILDDNQQFLISDVVPKIIWHINPERTKTIVGYPCEAATGRFRGRSYTAYFTRKIPYSVGPYKFYGLPGAILDIRVDGSDYYIWKAIEVNKNFDKTVNFRPHFLQAVKINMPEFLEIEDTQKKKYFQNANIPGSIVHQQEKRAGIEAVYEWEDE